MALSLFDHCKTLEHLDGLRFRYEIPGELAALQGTDIANRC